MTVSTALVIRVDVGPKVKVVVARQQIGASVTVSSPGGTPVIVRVVVTHSDCQQAGMVGQRNWLVVVGVVGQAGFGPGIVTVVGRRSTVDVHPQGSGGVDGPVHVVGNPGGGAHGGAIRIVDVKHGGQMGTCAWPCTLYFCGGGAVSG